MAKRPYLMLSMLSLLFLAAPATATVTPSVAESPFELRAFTAHYSAKIKKGISLDGKAVRKLKNIGKDRWEYRFVVESLPADINESSVFLWDGKRIKPKSYQYELSGMLIKDRKRTIAFDWKAKTASGNQGKAGWEIELPDIALDRLSYQLQLVTDIATRHNPLHYEVVHKGRIEVSNFQILKTETISTALGKMESLLVEKVRAPERPRKTLLWFSTTHPLLLLKMYQLEKNGEEYEIQLQSVTYP